uniref:Si:dkey-71h2.2 n=1 Tax=Stegastes partitus TaxID=144197 RepID=A0A3B4ZL94_9TELE
MDALKSAGRAIIKSPGVPRHTWGTSKHEKLPENWTDTKETLLEGMVFNVKYLGMTLVGQPKGEDMASAAIHRIVAMARASAKKFRKVTLTVSPKGIIITDTETADLIENVSIYRDPFAWFELWMLNHDNAHNALSIPQFLAEKNLPPHPTWLRGVVSSSPSSRGSSRGPVLETTSRWL